MKLYTQYLLPQVTAPSDAAPVAGMNTAPLIGVLLVLIVMLVFTYPAPMHSVFLSMPSHLAPTATGEVVFVKIDANGFVEWNDDRQEKLTDSEDYIATAPQQRVQPKFNCNLELMRFLLLSKKCW